VNDSESEIEQTATLRGGKVLMARSPPCLYRAPEPRRFDDPPGGVLLWAPGTNGHLADWGSAADRPLPPTVLGRLFMLKSPGPPPGLFLVALGSSVRPNFEASCRIFSNFNNLYLRAGKGCRDIEATKAAIFQWLSLLNMAPEA
jgi:hypothetical protein